MLAGTETPMSGSTGARTYTIGELADEFGLTPRTLRFYEDEGLVSPSRQGQNRVYSRKDRARIMLILRGKRLGFSIGEIKEFINLYSTDERQVEQMRYALQLGRKRIVQLEQQLRDVQQTLAELKEIDRQIVDHLDHQGVPIETE